MRRGIVWLLAFLLLLPALAQAANSHSTTDASGEMRAWFGDTLHPSVVSGCTPAVPGASLTLAAFACAGYVRSSTGELVYLTQAAATVTLANTNGEHWVAVHRDTSSSVSGWTRRAGSHYLFRQTATRPADPAGGLVVAQVTVAASVISAVVELAPRHLTGAETVSVSRTVDALWRVQPGALLTVATGVTITHRGQVEAPCRSAQPWLTLVGTGVLNFTRQHEVCPEWWGAYNDGTNATTTTAAINQAVESLQTAGGIVRFGLGTYKIEGGVSSYDTAIWVRRNSITFQCAGYGSVLQTTNDLDTAINVSLDRNPADTSPGGVVTDFTIQHCRVRGTGVFDYSALGSARGVHGVQVQRFHVLDSWIENFGMIGVDLLGAGSGLSGTGNAVLSRNQVHGNLYTGLNCNADCFQSLIAHNTISGSIIPVGNADGIPPLNAALIQSSGGAIIQGNTLWNSSGFGILLGESPAYTTSLVTGNYIKQTNGAGIQAYYSGPSQIHHNMLINCNLAGGLGSLVVSGGTTGALTVPNQENTVTGNTILNCLGKGIFLNAAYSSAVGNHIYYKDMTGIPQATTTQSAITTAGGNQWCVYVSADRVSVVGNKGNNCDYGLGLQANVELWSASGNDWSNVGIAGAGWFNGASAQIQAFVYLATEGGSLENGGHVVTRTAAIPATGTAGRFPRNSRIYSSVAAASGVDGWIQIFPAADTTTTGSVLNTNVVPVTSAASYAVNDDLCLVDTAGATPTYNMQCRIITGIVGTDITTSTNYTVLFTSGAVAQGRRWKTLGVIGP